MWQMHQNQAASQLSGAHTTAPPVLSQSMACGAAPPVLNQLAQSQPQLNDSTGQPWREDDEILLVDEDFAMLPVNQVEPNTRENIKVTQFDEDLDNYELWKNEMMARLSQDNMLQQNDTAQCTFLLPKLKPGSAAFILIVAMRKKQKGLQLRQMTFYEECSLLKAWYPPVKDNSALNAQLGELAWDRTIRTLKDIIVQIMHAYVSHIRQI